jgi:hypothetical protein
MGCIITNAEPTFSNKVDANNYPIFGRVEINAITMYTATKNDIEKLATGWEPNKKG